MLHNELGRDRDLQVQTHRVIPTFRHQNREQGEAVHENHKTTGDKGKLSVHHSV